MVASSAGQSIGLLIPDRCASVRDDARQYGPFRSTQDRTNTLECARTHTKSPDNSPTNVDESR